MDALKGKQDMDGIEKDKTNSKERDQCVAHVWRSASNSPEIIELTIDRGIKTVALGSEHGIFLGFNRQVYARGSNNCGQLGLGDFVDRADISVISYLTRKKVVEIECGSRHSGALTSDGNVYCWGDTSSGQCGVGDIKTVSSPARLYFVDSSGKDSYSFISQLAFGELHSMGLTNDGQVWAWGSGAALGLGGGMERALTPKKIEDFVGKKVLSMACGSYHSMAIVEAVVTGDTGKSNESFSQDCVDNGQNRKAKLSSRLKIRQRSAKDLTAERSNSVPLVRKSCSSRITFTETDSSSSESDMDEHELKSSPSSISESQKNSPSGTSHTLKPEDINLISPKNEETTQQPAAIVGTLDSGFKNLTDVMMKSMNGVLSLTSSLTGHTSSTDGSMPPKRVKGSSKVKPQMYEPVCVQVWTWGRGTWGQLGHGTTEDRLYPSLVDELSGLPIVKVVAGTHHSLALTSYCQVYAWGDNSHAQLAIKKNVINKPRKVKSLSNVLVWDIAAGSHYSMFLGDSFQNKTNIYVCGKKPSGLPMSCMTSLMEFRETLNGTMDPDGVSNTIEKPGPLSPLSPSRSHPDIRTITSISDGVKIGQMVYFRKSGVLRKIFSCGEQCVCLAVREPTQWFSIVAEMASRERAFYYKLALIWQAVLEPLLVSGLTNVAKNELIGQILSQISKAFHQLMRHVTTACKRLSQHVNEVNCTADVIAILSDEKYFHAFEKYSKVHSDGVACGIVDSLGKDGSSVLIKSRTVFEEVLDGFCKGTQSDSEAFKEILMLPLLRIAYYAESITTLQSLSPEESVEHKALCCISNQWEKLSSSNEERLAEAKLTNEFWQECPPKLVEMYKAPHRRVLKNSKINDLLPAKQGRFSSHWFVLLSDTFLHIQSNKNYQAHDLATVWASPVVDTLGENFTHAIRIMTPEDAFTVCSKTALEKAQWLVAINQAVAKVISKTTSYRLSSETVNTRCGSFTPAKAREATYFYLQDPKYKGACYTGMWLSGKPHGHGKMVWSLTAQTYEGEFRNGLYHGFGRMVFVLNASAGVAEEYEGEWKNGLMHGHGKMSYSDRHTYEGHWVQNVRHGHGVLRMGTLTSPTPSIYIGNWDNDKRSGFGVMDDIMRGEKYMGMWDNDIRSGKGLIVTLEGIYNEGRFVLNKLMGHGILLCDDNTKFEGDFCGDAQISGKGLLTLPNGDSIEGTFQGAWNDGLKVNGVYHKGSVPQENSSMSFSERSDPPSSQYYIPAYEKWRSVFNECRDRLGCRGDVEPDQKKAWKCVSEDLARGPAGKWQKQEREVIDDVLRGVDLDQAKKIAKSKKKLQEYLSKAFDLPCHPFGRLLETLVDVYRATYVGMGAHSRLLPHAVEEIKSYLERVYSIIRILFPCLPSEDFVHVGETVGDHLENPDDDAIDSSSLLGPLMFPRFYPPLFTLYALHNEKNDSAYWERVHQLNKRTDLALMSYLEIKRTFWLVPEGINGVIHETDHSNWQHTHYYEKAVEAFQQISTKFSPMEKLSVLKETFQRIHKEVRDFSKGKAKLMSLDDLFPVFQFVVIRSRVHHLGSEIDFIEDLMQAKHRVGEEGHMFTTLKACYFQILNEN